MRVHRVQAVQSYNVHIDKDCVQITVIGFSEKTNQEEAIVFTCVSQDDTEDLDFSYYFRKFADEIDAK